ncbi:MAG TPA: PAS domain S-box protein [Candidatus Thermoplasmatota archaeon]|nr:PAS domain S-box protein [Candidatus Thermoplasmatota archaeon]
MGDRRYAAHYERIRRAHDRAAAIQGLSDDEVVQALAAASRDRDPYVANVLATEAMNRMRRSRTIALNLAEGAFAVDESLVLTFVNPAMAAMLGGDWGGDARRSMVEAITMRDPSGTPVTGTPACPVRRCLEDGRVHEWEGTIARLEGPEVAVSMVVAPIVREGHVDGAVVAFRDVTDRRRLEREREAALRALEAERVRLQAVLEQMPSGVAIAEAPSGKLLFHNQEAVAILGHPLLPTEDVRGYARYGAVREDGAPYAPGEYPIARALRGEVVRRHEMRYRRGDGAMTRIVVNAAPVRDGSGSIVAAVSTFHDVAEAKRVEESLRMSEARLRGVLMSLHEGLVLFEPDGRAAFANTAALRILGLPPSAMDRHPLDAPLGFRTLEGEPIPPGETPVGVALRERRPVHDARILLDTPDRGARHVLASAIPIEGNGVVASFEDVTDDVEAERRLRESEAALRRSEAQYRALVENSPEPMAVHARGTLRFINRAGARLIGAADTRQLLGRNVLDFVHPDSVPLVKQRLAQIHASPDILPAVEERFLRLDGTPVDVETVAIPITYEGEPAVQLIFRDITHRKAHDRDMERRVAERTAELQRALKDLETFSNSASHDLRAPLRGVDVLCADLAESLARGEAAEAADLAGRIRRENRKAQRLVQDLLSFARSGKADLDVARVDVSALAADIAAGIDAANPERRATWRIEPGIVADADPALLRIALHNLLDNASKYASRAASPRVEVTATAGEDATTLHVRDNGVGFPPGEAHRLFQTFARLSTARGFEGTGLGLATVQRIVARHGGRVRAESRAGETTFSVELPRKR